MWGSWGKLSGEPHGHRAFSESRREKSRLAQRRCAAALTTGGARRGRSMNIKTYDRVGKSV
eukprot:SAG11_NODE_35095_length_268_cov_0.917160_1_plen_60_part_01